jgi:hypothetical protein
MVVANRFGDELAHPEPPPLVRIPYDPEVLAAESAGRAPMDACPHAASIRVVEQFLQHHLIEEVTP